MSDQQRPRKPFTVPFRKMLEDFTRKNARSTISGEITERIERAAGVDDLRDRVPSWAQQGNLWGDLEGKSWGELEGPFEQVLEVAKNLPPEDRKTILDFLESADTKLSELDSQIKELHTKADASGRKANWHLAWGIVAGALIGVAGNFFVAWVMGG
ncbi:hypothetical protein ABZ635_16710 [Nocardiopsis sp. NPDC007018]|uniref:hypothetical protein n=1 Tax=Nocardiopsis sp. NPDC007018 TaxID=3155721 RepID=UPI003408573E